MSKSLPILLAALLFVSCIRSDNSRHTVAPGSVEVGQTAPEIVGKDLDGTEFQLSDYRGKVVMLDFWGNW